MAPLACEENSDSGRLASDKKRTDNLIIAWLGHLLPDQRVPGNWELKERRPGDGRNSHSDCPRLNSFRSISLGNIRYGWLS